MTESYNDIVNRIYTDALMALAGGKNRHEVTRELIQQGVAPQLAAQLVAQADRAKKSAFRKEGLKTFAAGGGLLFLGTIITVATYSAAEPGGVFLVTTGLFLVGALNLLRGIYRIVVG
jgi:hypothetical protein